MKHIASLLLILFCLNAMGQKNKSYDVSTVDDTLDRCSGFGIKVDSAWYISPSKWQNNQKYLYLGRDTLRALLMIVDTSFANDFFSGNKSISQYLIPSSKAIFGYIVRERSVELPYDLMFLVNDFQVETRNYFLSADKTELPQKYIVIISYPLESKK